MRTTFRFLKMMTSSRTINQHSWYSWAQMRRRFFFALELLWLRVRGLPPICPYCRAMQHRTLGRKYLFLTAKQCDFCGLIYRWPVESSERTKRFYQSLFVDLFEDTTGTITEIESGEMDRLIAAKFRGVKYDYYHKLGVIQHLTGSFSGTFLDFGCGWSYITFQAREMGWEVEGFDVNAEYARFADEKLNIHVHTDEGFITNPEYYRCFDMIFMHHVLEHLLTPRQTLDNLYQILKPGGYLVIVVPNAASDRWNHSAAQTLGQNHISAFTKTWFNSNLPGHGFVVKHIVSAPYVFDDTKDGFAETIGVRGFEIMTVAQRPEATS